MVLIYNYLIKGHILCSTSFALTGNSAVVVYLAYTILPFTEKVNLHFFQVINMYFLAIVSNSIKYSKWSIRV